MKNNEKGKKKEGRKAHTKCITIRYLLLKDRKLRWQKQAFFIYLKLKALQLKQNLTILFLVLIEKFKLV